MRWTATWTTMTKAKRPLCRHLAPKPIALRINATQAASAAEQKTNRRIRARDIVPDPSIRPAIGGASRF